MPATTLCERCKYSFIPTSLYPPVPPDLLHSDHVPSEKDLTQAFSMLAYEEQELARINAEIARLDQAIKKLAASKAQLHQRITERRNWVSVKRRIPVEVWDEIFRFTCFGSQSKQEKGESQYSLSIKGRPFSVDTPALTLSHVSARWRDLVVCRPQLWSTLSIDLYDIHDRQRLIPLLELYLRRSGSCPLDVRIVDAEANRRPFHVVEDVGVLARYYIGSAGLELLTTLMTEMHRFSSLELSLDAEILQAIQNPEELSLIFPLLHSLRTSFSLDEDEVGWFSQAVEEAPKLATFQTKTPAYPGWEIGWSQLTALTFDEVPWLRGLLEMLEVTPNLESLTITEYRAPTGTTSLSSVVLPKLQHFTIALSGTFDQASALFESLTFPNLLSFHASCLTHCTCTLTTYLPGSSILAFLQRSSANLHTLSVHCPNEYLTPKSVIAMLESCPKVERLSIMTDSSPHNYVEVLRRLTLDWDAFELLPPLCPRLRQISIHDPQAAVVPVSDLVEAAVRMGESRTRKAIAGVDVAPLETVLLEFSSKLDWSALRCAYHDPGTPNRVLPGVDKGIWERRKELKRDGTKCVGLGMLTFQVEE
ncbi:hypothetical protein WG66_014868 [Moniliophthora roreri]|nr:hypothetical protein WG66_014868 [Moniliophthora roreri]